MPSITPVKTDSVTVLSHQAVTHPVTVVGSAIDCRTKRSVTIFLYHAYVEAAADTDFGKFLIQVRPDTGEGAATEHWASVVELGAKNPLTPFAATRALSGTEGIGDTSLAVSATTGFAAGDLIYIQDTGTLADSEWNRLKTLVANTNLQLLDGLTNAKDSADVIWGSASKFVVTLSLESIESFRVVWQHEGATGANGHIKALAVTYDSDLSA